jgi:hypothetical protein
MPDAPLQTDSLHCPDCGYNLFGIESDRCPECGLTIDRSILGDSRIPWVHRGRIGRIRAFWRTVILATARPRILAQEVNRPVSYIDAIKFRRVCLVLAWLPLVTAVAVVWGIIEIPMHAWERVGLALICGFSTWVYLLCITGLPSLFSHPRTLPVLRQNRAVALSFYCAGPLAWMILPTVVLCISFVMLDGPNSLFGEAETLLVIGYALLGLLFAAHFGSSFVLLKHATLCSVARRWTMDICLVSAWIGLFWIIAIGIPMIAIYITVVVLSLL